MEKTEKTVRELLDSAVVVVTGKIPVCQDAEQQVKGTQAIVNISQAINLYESFEVAPLPFEQQTRFIISKVRTNLSPLDMMKATQAVLNIMHANSQALATKQSKQAKPKTT